MSCRPLKHRGCHPLPKLLALVVMVSLSVTFLQIRVKPVPNLLIQSNVYSTTWNVHCTRAVTGRDTPFRIVELPHMAQDNQELTNQLPAHNLTIFSAIGRNRSRESGWDTVILNAWEGKTHMNDSYDCCLLYNNGDVMQVGVVKKNHWLQCKKAHYVAMQIVCPNMMKGNGAVPVGVSVVESNSTCNSNNVSPVPVHLPLKHEDYTTALCAKIAYGSVSPKRLIEWYEVQLQMGVSKVVTYSYNLTKEALKVLQYYQSIGLVDLIPYNYPHKREIPRSVGDKTGQVFNDEQVASFDCIERLAGYHFVGLIDHDEFLIPTPTILMKWKQLFIHLLKKKPNSSGFSFRTELFLLDWKNEINRSLVDSVAPFVNRTRPMWDRRKNIFLPERVVPGSVWTHNYTDAPGYEKFLVRSGFATLKHFRTCRNQWLENNSCFRRRRYQDHHVTDLINKVRSRIRKVENEVLK